MDELRKGFHQQLDDVRTELVRLAASVIEAIPRATAVILNGDLEGADALIQFDDEIDSLSLELEERCYQILALQAPVAGDLRQVVSVVKMIAEIERSADLAVNICKAARRIYGHDLDPRLRGLIARMGEQAEQLWESALESFQENDAAKAVANAMKQMYKTKYYSKSDCIILYNTIILPRLTYGLGSTALSIYQHEDLDIKLRQLFLKIIQMPFEHIKQCQGQNCSSNVVVPIVRIATVRKK